MEFGFYCDEKEFDKFPNMDLGFEIPGKISNAILEISSKCIDKLRDIVFQLEELGCKYVVLVSYEELNYNDYFSIKSVFDETSIASIEIISKYSYDINEVQLNEISLKFERLTSLFFFSSPQNHQIKWSNKTLCDIIFSKNKYKNFSFCGIVNTSYFNINQLKVLEAVNYNSCLFKKISIDLNGDIRNCPAMNKSFGNVKDIKLEKALKHPEFKEYWDINKDKIDVCKDCEFRYICTDCRGYTERSKFNKDDLDISKPLKCGYSPYTGKWEEWSTNPLKQKLIDYYKFFEL